MVHNMVLVFVKIQGVPF